MPELAEENYSESIMTIASRDSNEEKISAILQKCMKVETYTIEKYELLASQTDNPHAKTLFERLSTEGETHAKILEIIREALTESGEIDKPVVISSQVAIPKDVNSQKYRTDVEETYHAMKSHIALERGIGATYLELGEKVKNPTAVSLFRGLAEDEKSHHKELALIIRKFEEIYRGILKKR